MLVPVRTQHFETPYLSRGAHMTPDAGTDIIVADAHQPDGVAHIVRQAVKVDVIGQVVAADELERHWQVVGNERERSA